MSRPNPLVSLASGLALLGAILSLGACAGRQAVPYCRYRPQDDCRLHASASAYGRVGGASGYLQTPKGGAAGTTDLRRPTLSEIGVTSAVEYGTRVEADYRRHRASLEVSNMQLNGEDTLTRDLTSQSASFPAGTRVVSNTDLANYQLGYSYLFEVPLGGADRLELRPGVGVRAIGVGYQLDGSNGQRASRHYTPTAPNLDLQWAWRPRAAGNIHFSGYLGHTLEAQFSDPLRRMKVFEATGRANYDFSSRGSVFLEVGYKDILLQDTQPDMQNRIKTEFGPWIGLGGELRL